MSTDFGTCPVEGCTTRLTHKYAVVCPDHYFCVEPKEVSFVRTLMIRADRTRDAETRDYLNQQIPGYKHRLVRLIGENSGART